MAALINKFIDPEKSDQMKNTNGVGWKGPAMGSGNNNMNTKMNGVRTSYMDSKGQMVNEDGNVEGRKVQDANTHSWRSLFGYTSVSEGGTALQ